MGIFLKSSQESISSGQLKIQDLLSIYYVHMLHWQSKEKWAMWEKYCIKKKGMVVHTPVKDINNMMIKKVKIYRGIRNQLWKINFEKGEMKYLEGEGKLIETRLGTDTKYPEYWGKVGNFIMGHPCHVIRHLIQQDQFLGLGYQMNYCFFFSF